MNTKKDGGAAFPGIKDGMSLRDWFAGMALATISLRELDDKHNAIRAYRIADAMLAEREK